MTVLRQYFKKVTETDTGIVMIALCIECKLKVSAKADRLRTHHDKCANGSKNNTPRRTAVAATTCSRPTTSAIDKDISVVLKNLSSKNKLLRSKLKWTHVAKTLNSQKESCDLRVIKAFYACNLVCNIIEHPKSAAD